LKLSFISHGDIWGRTLGFVVAIADYYGESFDIDLRPEGNQCQVIINRA
jgi:hypothetical protein